MIGEMGTMEGYRIRDDRWAGQPYNPQTKPVRGAGAWLDVEFIAEEQRPADDWCFVFGAGRSGTTAATIMLNAHRDVVVSAEAWLWGYAEQLMTSYVWADRPARAGIQIANARLLEAAGGLHDDGVLEIRASQVREVMEGFRRAFGGAVLFGDKRSAYGEVLDRMDAVLPGHRAVVTRRDARDVAASMLLQEWWRRGPRETLERAEEMCSYYDELARDRGWFVLDFEAAAEDVEAVAGAMLEALDLDPTHYDWNALEHMVYAETVGRWRDVPEIVGLVEAR